ncbi:MAG: hypothetical protein IKH90_06590, partial [Ruminococcus sp.]|nr:hypothetical protein [Ruminococcus sp.]
FKVLILHFCPVYIENNCQYENESPIEILRAADYYRFISANVNAMAGTSGNEDYEFKVMNLLKMWGIPIGYAFVYILLGIAFLSLVDRDKR